MCKIKNTNSQVVKYLSFTSSSVPVAAAGPKSQKSCLPKRGENSCYEKFISIDCVF